MVAQAKNRTSVRKVLGKGVPKDGNGQKANKIGPFNKKAVPHRTERHSQSRLFVSLPRLQRIFRTRTIGGRSGWRF